MKVHACLNPNTLHMKISSCNFVTSPYHALKRVLCVCSLVQQFAVLQFLTQPLQCVEWLVELNRHGYFRQVLPNVVLQDVPQADVAGIGTGGGKTRPALFLRTTVLYTC